jgi:hypothetical protein
MKQFNEKQIFNRVQHVIGGQDPVIVIRALIAHVGLSLRQINDPQFNFAALDAIKSVTDRAVADITAKTVHQTPIAAATAEFIRTENQ